VWRETLKRLITKTNHQSHSSSFSSTGALSPASLGVLMTGDFLLAGCNRGRARALAPSSPDPLLRGVCRRPLRTQRHPRRRLWTSSRVATCLSSDGWGGTPVCNVHVPIHQKTNKPSMLLSFGSPWNKSLNTKTACQQLYAHNF